MIRRALAALAAAVCLSGCARAATVEIRYGARNEALVNPYIGNAVWANSIDEDIQPFTLVYANLTWADFEPEEGAYDFESFERENHFEYWRAAGKKLILRFVMDIPDEGAHRDIPDWLYAQTRDGCAYHVSYGRGYCPNYENETLIAAHARAIAALGQRYDGDGFLAYVELGSLGHWGEWHVHEDAGGIPPEAVRDRYAQPYVDAFHTAKLLMRRPFAFAAEHGLGLFNDASAEPSATRRWLSWIDEGGAYDQTGEKNALTPMPDAWKTAPIGGELTTNMTVTQLLAENLWQTASFYARSHASWIGPGSFADEVEPGGELQSAYDVVNRSLGYRLRVSRAEIAADDGGADVSLFFENEGTAPFYFGWTPALRLTADGKEPEIVPLDLDLLDVLPGESVEVRFRIDISGAPCLAEVGILDPETGRPGVALDMDAPCDENWYTLFAINP